MKGRAGAGWMLWLVLSGCGLGDPLAAPSAAEEAEPAGPAAPSLTPAARPRQATREELLARLREPLSRSSHDLVWRPRPGGGAGADLQGRHQHAMVARRDADGRLRLSCVSSLEAAERALAENAP